MRQSWRDLTFLHWELAPDQLRPHLPPGLTLDLYEGRAFIGLVPFTMVGVRPEGLPAVRWLSNFHETNVRTYVHVEGRDPGVWFFSLDAANRVAVLAARASFHLPYHFAQMRLTRTPASVAYGSRRLWPGPRPAECAVEMVPRGIVAVAQVGTLEHFLAERYFLYATARGRLFRGQVHHTPYPLQPAEVLTLEESLIAAAGLTRPPEAPLAHFATGVDVEVFGLQRIR